MVYIADFDRFADLECAFVCFLKTHNHAEEGSFTGSVRTNNSDNAIWRKHEVHIFKEQLVTKGFADSFRVNHFISESRTVWNEDLQFLFALFLLFVQHSVICCETGFSFGLTGFRSHMYPF